MSNIVFVNGHFYEQPYSELKRGTFQIVNGHLINTPLLKWEQIEPISAVPASTVAVTSDFADTQIDLDSPFEFVREY